MIKSMNMNYYIPTIKEIIEYIINEEKLYTIINDKIIEIKIESNPTGLIHFIDSNNLYINSEGLKIYGITPELYMIKYLDKEDIKYFRFNLDKLPYRWKFENYILIKLNDENLYTIIDNRYEERIFRGNIKNKLELKRILKQLEIWD